MDCSGSVSGHAQNDASGKCCWCGRRLDPPVPPSRHGWGPTELDQEYRRTYDPDYGSGPYDV